MSGGAWFVWAAGRTAGCFPTAEQAVRHCRVLTNDHRTHVETNALAPNLWRYIGPRGRRHGTRLIAFVGTLDGLRSIGVDTGALRDALDVEAAC